MPTATPAFTSLLRRCSLARSVSLLSVIREPLWCSACLWKSLHERAVQATPGTEERAGAGVRSSSPRIAVRIRRHRQDAGADGAGSPAAASGRETRIDPLSHFH